MFSGEVLSGGRELMKIIGTVLSIVLGTVLSIVFGGLLYFGLLKRAFDETYGVDDVGF